MTKVKGDEEVEFAAANLGSSARTLPRATKTAVRLVMALVTAMAGLLR